MAIYETGIMNFNVKKFGPIITIFFVLLVFIIAVGTSIVNIGPDEVGIVAKKFGGGELPDGRIVGVKGENGFQASVLMPGWHFSA